MEFTTHLELQSQTTRLVENQSYLRLASTDGAVTLHGTLFQEILLAIEVDLASLEHNSEDFRSELFPLHSPLLRESLLVSLPPPSYMLKFSGYS